MIQIGMGADILRTSAFVISWHGFLSFVGVLVAVVLVVRWASPQVANPAKPKTLLGRIGSFARRFLGMESDLFLGKLEKELEGTIRQVRDTASQYFKDIRLREVAETPQGIALASGELPDMIKKLPLEARMRVTVVTRDGGVVADTADDPGVRDMPAVLRDAQSVLNGFPSMAVRTVNGEEHAVFTYPVMVERPVATKVEVGGGTGEARVNVLMERT